MQSSHQKAHPPKFNAYQIRRADSFKQTRYESLFSSFFSTQFKLTFFLKSSSQIVESNTVVLEAVHDPVIEITNETVQTTGVHKNSLYPNLDTLNALNESLNKFGFTDLGSQHSLPPPTYSDSESYYNDQKQPDSYRAVKPTAPSPPPPPSNTFRSVSFNLDRNQINELNSSSDQ